MKKTVVHLLTVLLSALLSVVWPATSLQAQTVEGVFEIRNRIGRAIPVAIVPIVLDSTTNVTKMAVVRCNNNQDVPFYVEPWTVGTDSVVCWVRLNNLGGGERVSVNVISNAQQTVSKSNGSATFLAFTDNITPRNATSAVGPLSVWNGAQPEFGTGLLVEARVRATGVGGGLFGYYGANAQYSAGYVVHHSTRPGSTEPDHHRIEGGTSNQITPAFFEWQVNEPVRYQARITADSNIIIRTSETDNKRVHQLRTLRSETDWEWITFGAASFASSPNTLAVDWVRVRPWIELPPTVTRRNATVTVAPSNAVICNGAPVVVTGPAGWTEYEWSNGDTTQTASLRVTGQYSLTVRDANGCAITFPPISVTRDTIPSVGADTAFTLCFGRSATLRVPDRYSSYRWYIATGQRQSLLTEGIPSISIDSAEVYTCIVGSAGGCSDTMLFRISRVFDTTARVTASNPQASICEGDTLTLYASPSNSRYTWYRDSILLAETSDRLKVTRGGTYYVTVRIGDTANACLSIASIVVTENERKRINLRGSYEICQGSVLRLGIPDSLGYPTFEWSTGAVGQSINIRDSGDYWVFASYYGTCGDTAFFSVKVNPSPPVAISVKDDRTSMCTGEELELTASTESPAQLFWNTNENTQTITIKAPGTYTVRAVYPNGCERFDTVMIDDGLAIPDIVSVDFQTLCPNQSTRLTTVGKFDTYLWSTGATTDTILISQPGDYWVEVTLFECSARREFSIKPTEPGGLTVAMADTLATCAASPLIPFTVSSNQDVERVCTFTMLAGPAVPVSTTIVINEYSSTDNALAILAGTPPGRYTIRYRMEDNCGWNEEFTVVASHGPRDLDVAFAVQAPVATSIRAGDNIVLELRGTDNSGLRRFFREDTVLLTLKVNTDLFHLTSATSSCANQVVSVNDAEGTVTYTLSDCANGTVEPFVSQQATVLVGESLDGWVRVEEVRGTNPCFTFPILSDALPIAAYGCTISTIERATAPVINVVELSDQQAVVRVSSHEYPVTLRCVDPMGRVLRTLSIANEDYSEVVVEHPGGPFFLQAVNLHGSSHVAIMRAE